MLPRKTIALWLLSICTCCIFVHLFAVRFFLHNPEHKPDELKHQHTKHHLTRSAIDHANKTEQCSRGVLHGHLESLHIAHTYVNTPPKKHGEKDRRPSYPFISGDAFRAMCQLRCEDSSPDRACTFSATDVTPGACVYVATTNLQTSKTTDAYLHAFAHIAPHVQHDFVVITHNGDLSTPDGDDWHMHEGAVWSASFSFMLQLPRLVAWFASNCNANQSTPGADKVHCIPIGIENRYNKIGKTPERYHEALRRANNVERTETLLVAFSAHRLKPWRDTALAGLLPRWKQTHFSTWEAWASAVHRHKFVACPVGHGYDTHRTWEVLLAGSVPLVDSTPMDAMYTGLPVVIVNNWTLVTEAYLLNAYDELCARRDYTPSKIFFSYWHDLIASIAHSARADKTTPGSLQDTLAKMPPGDILFSYGNRDYLPFHLHWLCNTRTWAGVHARTLLVVDDEYSRAAIRRLSPDAHVHILPSMHQHKGFYSKGYRKLTIQRVEILVDLLRSGRGVVMFEGDAVWTRNILTDPNLTNTRRKHDVAFYRDGVGGWMIGAGMMGMKGGRGPALRMWERVLAQLSTDMQPYEHLPDSTVISKSTAKHEQDILREDVIPSMLESGELKSIDLDRCLYVSGLWYRDPTEHRARCGGTIPYVLNNNYIIGNARKQERAHKHGHWFLGGSQCKDIKSKLAEIVASFAADTQKSQVLEASDPFLKVLDQKVFSNTSDVFFVKPCMQNIFSRVRFPQVLPSIQQAYGIDGIFVVHYKPLKHRRQAMDLRVRSVFKYAPTFVEELDRNELSDADFACASDRHLQHLFIKRPTKRGEDSLTLKHMAVFNFMMQQNITNVLVLEDDAVFLQTDWISASSQWQNILLELPKDYDILMLSGYKNFHRRGKQISKHLFLAQQSRVSSAYVISKKGAMNMLRTLPIVSPIDFQINYAGGHKVPNNLPPANVVDMKILWSEPPMCEQYDETGLMRTVSV